jgi:hypothetical protein
VAAPTTGDDAVGDWTEPQRVLGDSGRVVAREVVRAFLRTYVTPGSIAATSPALTMPINSRFFTKPPSRAP